ncbi:uncharacterized protein C18orf63 homolog isoform X2 [Hyla sarda]|nr:uncharacterized protein C18orf63 homolog isoform X2 [Hyla sarda]XP_056377417.1 uncharacterized protein C18orf63 homolog isoform X2 [Hyla sarda]XP_056377418.1 uncharacterized protein C18orf63 homolog isoform X2 [Hyla sarda]
MEESIFFWDLPDLKNLCAVKIILNTGISHPDIRDQQVKLCRCLLFLYDQIVASPIPEEFSQILVIMSISFYKSGKLQLVTEKQQVKMERPERVTPAMLQTCLFYTITARLAPSWNKAGHLLIQGPDFLTKSGKQDAVAISVNISDNQLFITVQVHTVRLPPSQLRDFDVASECFESSLTWNSLFIRKKNNSSSWCYVLPSMKMGRIVDFSHDIPTECPFKSYKDFQDYWKTLYGYELPNISLDDLTYCSVYFKFIGEKLFTYPLICLRSQPIQFYPRADVTRVLNIFVDDLKSKIPNLCGFPVNMTNIPVHPVKGLARPLQQGNKHLNNLMSSSQYQSVGSTEVIQNTISLDQSLESSEKLEHPPTSLCRENMTSFKVSLGSQHFESPNPICSTRSENVQKYKPFFHGKTKKVNQKDNIKFAKGNTIVVGSNIYNNKIKCNTSNSNSKDIIPSKTSFIEISDAKRNTASNVLHKPIKMKCNKEAAGNTTLLPCPSPLSENQSCISACSAPGKDKSELNPKNTEPSHSQTFENSKVNFTNGIVARISNARREDNNVSCKLHEDHLQEENLVSPPKKCKTIKYVKKVDVVKHARDNKLFKLNNADLQDWLKQHGISTRTRDKKEQLVAKIMHFLQQS